MSLDFLKNRPTKIICVGLNYKDHAKEMKLALPKEPLLFMKPTTALIGPEEEIITPKMSERVEYEAELAIIIKDKIKDVEQKEVMKHIKGFTCFNDITARDLQKKDLQWTRAKGFDTFAAIGPRIVKISNPNKLKIELFVNGEKKQDSNTKNFIFKVEKIVSFISKIMTLLPGDIISTGTPAGIGQIKSGDVVEVKIEGIGTLKNYVK